MIMIFMFIAIGVMIIGDIIKTRATSYEKEKLGANIGFIGFILLLVWLVSTMIILLKEVPLCYLCFL